MESRGRLIVVEGLEGAGKSTAIHALIEVLTQAQIKTKTTREPGGTAIGETIRALIKNTEYKDVLDAKAELLLFYAARIQLIKEVIQPALAEGIWVVADRFELSTLAYQGGGFGLNMDFIQSLSAFCLQGFKPDLCLYLDINPELGIQRAASRGSLDRIEQQELSFFKQVHAAYQHYAKLDSSIVWIDAKQPETEVKKRIQTLLNHYLEKQQ